MKRQMMTFTCEGATLVGTLDQAAGTTGLLIVSGGNEVRHGAHRGMAMLAARLAAQGTPVFRYDRRGVGDSDGENSGFAYAGDDLRAAADSFRRAAPQVTRLYGFGNCDAASLLALEGRNAGIARVLLANPWTIEQDDDLPPAAAIRAGYTQQLLDLAEWRRLLRGGIDMGKAIKGLWKIARTRSQPNTLATKVTSAIAEWGDAVTVLLARDDNTARAFADAARAHTFHTLALDTSSHSFARAADKKALAEIVTRWLSA
ncbi:hydrolase 1, exosortase A system-associated [Sphingomonas sp. Mn802worker]|uniref:hydrolase 1, exosortase A system-associated n=1 Tax=Sphingomonas sp. Mn802worker TaxID=629773 RepID=UPI00047737A4|nr:hydrolase 1, exosortase A system-associated [Sphingomonas sp. Mn802worker]